MGMGLHKGYTAAGVRSVRQEINKRLRANYCREKQSTHDPLLSRPSAPGRSLGTHKGCPYNLVIFRILLRLWPIPRPPMTMVQGTPCGCPYSHSTVAFAWAPTRGALQFGLIRAF